MNLLSEDCKESKYQKTSPLKQKNIYINWVHSFYFYIEHYALQVTKQAMLIKGIPFKENFKFHHYTQMLK